MLICGYPMAADNLLRCLIDAGSFDLSVRQGTKVSAIVRMPFQGSPDAHTWRAVHPSVLVGIFSIHARTCSTPRCLYDEIKHSGPQKFINTRPELKPADLCSAVHFLFMPGFMYAVLECPIQGAKRPHKARWRNSLGVSSIHRLICSVCFFKFKVYKLKKDVYKIW